MPPEEAAPPPRQPVPQLPQKEEIVPSLLLPYFKNHAYVIGATGFGKTNFLLDFIDALSSEDAQSKEPCSIIVIDPHGPASTDGARMLMKKHWKEKVLIFDPNHTSFGLNPLEIRGSFSAMNDRQRLQKIQNQVGQLVSILVDVLGTDEAKAPRMMWIFRGCLYFLFMLGNNVTFLDLYQLMIFLMELTRANREKVIQEIFQNARVDDDITKKTIEAISHYNADAYSVVLNRISNFTIPPGSITTRTFCSRKTTIPFDRIMNTPGMVTFFRLSKADLPSDFRELLTNTLLLNIWYRILERQGEGHQVYLIIDEFQTVQKLEALETIISEGRKFKLSLIMVNQNLSQIERKPLVDSLLGNCGFIGAHQTGPRDAKALCELFGEEYLETMPLLKVGQMVIRLRPSDGSMPSTEIHTFPLADIPKQDESAREDVIQYMENELEKAYGGAVEDRKPIWQKKADDTMASHGYAPRNTLECEILLHLRNYENVELKDGECINTASHLEYELRKSHGWNDVQIRNAFLSLEGAGLIEKRAVFGKINQGKDDPHPNNVSELSSSKTLMYNLRVEAKEKYFGPLKIASARAGDLVHLAAIAKRREECWKNGEWVFVDLGERKEKRPDMEILRPGTYSVQTRDGIKTYESDAMDLYAAEEVETDPLRHKVQVLKNYDKNFSNYHPSASAMYKVIRFDVLLEEHISQIKEILREKDPNTYTVKLVDLGFSRAELEQRLGEDYLGAAPTPAEQGSSSPAGAVNTLPKNDFINPWWWEAETAMKREPPAKDEQKPAIKKEAPKDEKSTQPPTQVIERRAKELRDMGYKDNAVQGNLLREFGSERADEIKKAILDLKPFEEIIERVERYRKLGYSEDEIKSFLSNEDQVKVKRAVEETKDVQKVDDLTEKVNLCKKLEWDNPTIILKLSKEHKPEDAKDAVAAFDMIKSGAYSRSDIANAHSYLSKQDSVREQQPSSAAEEKSSGAEKSSSVVAATQQQQVTIDKEQSSERDIVPPPDQKQEASQIIEKSSVGRGAEADETVKSSDQVKPADAKTILDKFVNFLIIQPGEDSFTTTLEDAGKTLGISKSLVGEYLSVLKDQRFITVISRSNYKLTEKAKEEIQSYLNS